MIYQNLKLNAFSSAALSAYYSSDIILIEDGELSASAIGILDSLVSKNSSFPTKNSIRPPSIIKISPFGDFPKILQSALEPTETPTSVSVIATSHILLSLLPTVYSYSKLFSDKNKHIPSLTITIGISGPKNNQSDASDVMAYMDSKCSIFASHTIQQVFDFSLISSIISKNSQIPAISYFDSNILDNFKLENIIFRDFSSTVELYKTIVNKKSDEASTLSEKSNIDLESVNTQNLSKESNDNVLDGKDKILEQINIDQIISSSLDLFKSTPYLPAKYDGSTDASVVFVSITDFGFSKDVDFVESSCGYLTLYQVRPLPKQLILEKLPASVKKIVILEHIEENSKIWGPLVFDFIELIQSSAFKDRNSINPLIIDIQSPYSFSKQLSIAGSLKNLLSIINSTNCSKLFKMSKIALDSPNEQTQNNNESSENQDTFKALDLHQYSEVEIANQIPYQKLFETVFQDRFKIINSENPSMIWSNLNSLKSNPEYGFGILASQEQKQRQLHKIVTDILQDTENDLGTEINTLLYKWVETVSKANSDLVQLVKNINSAIKNYQNVDSPYIKSLKEYSANFLTYSNWLVGSDEWAVDFGNSGIHQVLSSGFNINMLILDSANYSDSRSDENNQLAALLKNKKDIGLYALNYGNAYVASISAYASYTQALTALIEASTFPGPSVVLAHIPSQSEKVINTSHSPIESMKLAKIAVDNGKWPLYRWTPKIESNNDGNFILDSQKLRNEIKQFLDKKNTLCLISNTVPTYNSKINNSVEQTQADAIAKSAKSDLEKLMAGLQGPSITILYASDGSNAHAVAKKIHFGAKARKMSSEIFIMNDFDFSEIEFKSLVIFVVSTAGQGEFPTNGKGFWKSLKDASVNLSNLKYSVFALGDSHYWPSEEDSIFYNKPGKDLDKRLFELSAIRLCSIGLGDDSNDNGWEAGFSAWEPELWKSLGYDSLVDLSNVYEDEPPKISDEDNKIQSNYLRGNIVAELNDSSKGDVDEFTGKLLKFHGTYGQDDRDIRDQRIENGLSPAYSFMIRVRLPAGKATCKQWIAMDDLATKYGNETIKITTRQTFQLHGVLKSNLRNTINSINKALMDTIAACGDVNRNVVSSANPLQPQLREEVAKLAKDISESLLPKTTAYHEIWVSDKIVAGQALQDFEPMYGQSYLPRKFKIAIAIPPENDVDVFAYDLGLIAILNESEDIIGYNVAVGGGMGMTHNNKKTYPRLASILGYINKNDVIEVSKAIVTTQRDFGDRKNRKHARMKYTIDDYGIDWFRSQVEERSNVKFEQEKKYNFVRNGDRYGWVDSIPGYKNYTMFVQNGRVADLPGYQLKSALRNIASVHKGYIQLTCNSHVIIADVANKDVANMDDLLKKLGVHNKNHSQLRLHSMACTSFPTCGLAMAESERYLPSLVTLLDETINEAGLRNDAIVIRMTGCPNGCARPYVAEIGLVGKAPGTYNLYLGGAHNGSRLNKVYKESVQEEEILEILKPLIKNYALEKLDDEKFGDYVIRSGVIRETFQGLDFHN
ncbi:hypothetical protein BB561_002827 [Smittium simulii]|uniref:assimilatory sulfite reductase (NADPH) n=1 Tax=Smittium simulii TaxID=133385 RepID=A0A2T9YP40_9FUNG|nr:hypothetical protein BB561_002827 [Smittium simulii]